MRVAVVDVGSNTVRLLVAGREGTRLAALREERQHLFLGADVERDGELAPERIEEAASCAGDFARLARGSGTSAVDVIVTAPGRQSANGAELLAALERAAGAPARILSADEEGRLAFLGAVEGARSLPETVAVCDVGGGSVEVVVGTKEGGPAWSRSLDIGAVRLAARFFAGDPPPPEELAAARDEVERHFAGFAPPLPQAALATGGTARALRKLSGRKLGADELGIALGVLGKRPSAKVAKTFGIPAGRARTLPAGALVLAAVQLRLGVPLQVSRAGLREGAALVLLDELAASAA